MKKLQFTMTKNLVLVNRLLTIKDSSGMNLRTSLPLRDNICQYRGKTSKIRLCPKKNTLPVKKDKIISTVYETK